MPSRMFYFFIPSVFSPVKAEYCQITATRAPAKRSWFPPSEGFNLSSSALSPRFHQRRFFSLRWKGQDDAKRSSRGPENAALFVPLEGKDWHPSPAPRQVMCLVIDSLSDLLKWCSLVRTPSSAHLPKLPLCVRRPHCCTHVKADWTRTRAH